MDTGPGMPRRRQHLFFALGIGTPGPQPRKLSKLVSLVTFSQSYNCLNWLIWGSSWGRGFRCHWLFLRRPARSLDRAPPGRPRPAASASFTPSRIEDDRLGRWKGAMSRPGGVDLVPASSLPPVCETSFADFGRDSAVPSVPLRSFSYLRCSYLRFQGLDFEQQNSKSCLRPLGTRC